MTYLTRAQLRREASVGALMPILMPNSSGKPTGHHLVWSLYADSKERRRDFLYREADNGKFYVLSARPPSDSPLFDIASRPFEPKLKAGDRLSFQLRANPVVRRKRDDGKTIKVDAVMHALLSVPAGQERRKARMRIAREVTEVWLRRLGETSGYQLSDLALEGYRQERLRRPGTPSVQFGVVDVVGTLTVTEPAVFLARLQEGFGAARAWGCGLMLIRRA
jgi:CRISPR system Cascade subunit CasE